MTRSLRAGLALVPLALVFATGFATCGGDPADEESEIGQSDEQTTIDEEQEDMDRDIDR